MITLFIAVVSFSVSFVCFALYSSSSKKLDTSEEVIRKSDPELEKWKQWYGPYWPDSSQTFSSHNDTFRR